MRIAGIRKLVAAVVGLIAMQLGPDILPAPEALTQAVLALLTAFGVWATPNDPGDAPLKPRR